MKVGGWDRIGGWAPVGKESRHGTPTTNRFNTSLSIRSARRKRKLKSRRNGNQSRKLFAKNKVFDLLFTYTMNYII